LYKQKKTQEMYISLYL